MKSIELGTKIVEQAKLHSPSMDTEAYVVQSSSRSEEWSEGLPENKAAQKSQGVGLRMIHEGRLGFASTNRSDDVAMAELMESASVATGLTSTDASLVLPGPQIESDEKNLDLDDR